MQVKNSSINFKNDFAVMDFNNLKPDSNDLIVFNFFDYQSLDLNSYSEVKEARKSLAREFSQCFYLDDIKKMIMEIEARNGKIFDEPKVQSYFQAKAWYKPDKEYNREKLSGQSKEILEFLNYTLNLKLDDMDNVSE